MPAKALASAGHRPVVFDDLSSGWRGAVRWGPLVEGDLLDASAPARAFAEHAPAAVMHFAGLSDVDESVHRPDLYWRTNVAGSLNSVAAAHDPGVDALVFSSTCATYGEHAGTALTEDDPQLPITP